MANKKTERTEAWIRIPVLIVSGIILYLWMYFVGVLAIVNWFYTVFQGKRLKELAEMSETWNTQRYIFVRYITFGSNKRPFPFSELDKNISKFEN